MKLSELGENIALAKDFVLNAVDFDFASAVFAEDHFVANTDAESGANAVIEQLARSNRDDLATLWLFLGTVWQNDTTSGGFFCFERLNNDSIIERTEIHLSHFNHPCFYVFECIRSYFYC